MNNPVGASRLAMDVENVAGCQVSRVIVHDYREQARSYRWGDQLRAFSIA